MGAVGMGGLQAGARTARSHLAAPGRDAHPQQARTVSWPPHSTPLQNLLLHHLYSLVASMVLVHGKELQPENSSSHSEDGQPRGHDAGLRKAELAVRLPSSLFLQTFSI